MKKIALSLLVALGCLTANGADGKSLFVNFSDGTKLEFTLATTPEITFGHDQMTIKTTEKTASFDLWKVATFTYGEGTTGISQTETAEKLAFEGNRILVDGTNNHISIFALDGKAALLSPIIVGDKTIINLNELTHGTYIIKINNKSIKIARQ